MNTLEVDLVKKLQAEGYDHVYIDEDQANAEDPPHQHDYETKLYILQGSIDIFRGPKKTTVRQGESVIIPRGTVHAAITGPDGCRYIACEQH